MKCHVCEKVIDPFHECTWTDGKRDYCSEACARSPLAVS